MDGTYKTYIVTTQLLWPNGLTIDFTCKDCIESASSFLDIIVWYHTQITVSYSSKVLFV